MKLGIIIPTYQRDDGKSLEFLKKALGSIKNQIHQDYAVYLIGDKYKNNVEFEQLATTIINKNKIKYINLPNAIEREKYPLGSRELWCAGGINASNIGIEMAISDGISYVCHLDHDDYWENFHLLEINNIIENNKNYVIIVTSSTHYNGNILPIKLQEIYYPIDSDVIRSATCIDFSRILLKYRDVYACTGHSYPGDADLWNRMSIYMKEKNMIGYHIKKITCHHNKERCCRKNN